MDGVNSAMTNRNTPSSGITFISLPPPRRKPHSVPSTALERTRPISTCRCRRSEPRSVWLIRRNGARPDPYPARQEVYQVAAGVNPPTIREHRPPAPCLPQRRNRRRAPNAQQHPDRLRRQSPVRFIHRDFFQPPLLQPVEDVEVVAGGDAHVGVAQAACDLYQRRAQDQSLPASAWRSTWRSRGAWAQRWPAGKTCRH